MFDVPEHNKFKHRTPRIILEYCTNTHLFTISKTIDCKLVGGTSACDFKDLIHRLSTGNLTSNDPNDTVETFLKERY